MDFNKPRICIFYWKVPSTGFRDDGPPLFVKHNLRCILGKDNVVWLWPHGDIKHFGKFDLHILVDHGEDAIGVPLDFEYPHPNVYWVSDAHLGYDYRLKRAKEFDYVFCCQKRAMEEFARDGVPREKLFWLPHAVEPECYKPWSVIPKYDWCFIGHLNSQARVDLLDRLCREFPNWYLGWRNPYALGYNILEDASRKFCMSKVVFNQSISDDINMRVFETLASKRLLLTNDIPTLHELFNDGFHLITYKTIDDAVKRINLWLDDDARDEREAIAECGYSEVVGKHTYKHRVLEILKTTINYKEEIESCHS